MMLRKLPLCDRGPERRLKGSVVAVETCLAGVLVLFRRDLGPAERPSCVPQQLPEEGPLRPAISLPERVGGVDLAEVVRGAGDELILREVPQVVLGGQVGEDLAELAADVVPVAQHAGADDVHRAELTGPRIDVDEEVAVERLEVRDVVRAVEAVVQELGVTGEGVVGLDQLQIVRIGDAEAVDKDPGVGIDVGVSAHR